MYPLVYTIVRSMVLLLSMIAALLPGEVSAQVFYRIVEPIEQHRTPGHDRLRGWLLGTLHSSDPRLRDWPPALAQALRSAGIVAIELRPDPQVRAALEAAMVLPAGDSLQQRLPEPLGKRVVEALVARGLASDRARRLEPWAAAMTLSLPPQDPSGPMDLALAAVAIESGARLVGLERVEEQLAFFRGLDDAIHLQLLQATVDAPEQLALQYRQMLESYLAGDLAGLVAQAEQQLQPLGPAAVERFIEHGLVRRNRSMLDRALPLLERDPTLIAVGALHLPGEHGLIAGLRAAGYELEAVY